MHKIKAIVIGFVMAAGLTGGVTASADVYEPEYKSDYAVCMENCKADGYGFMTCNSPEVCGNKAKK